MPLSIEAAIKISELPFVQEVSLLKQEVDDLRPLDNETEEKIIQKFRLQWNYHSNAIEGNQLTYGETYAFLMEGVTAKGKTLKDHLDIKGHDETVKYLFDLLKNRDYEITETEIRNLHKMLLKEPYEVDAITADGKPSKRKIKIGEYKSQPNHVITATGEIHYYATPQETPIKMGELMAWYKAATKNFAIHPLVIAALFHHEFTNIHPFDDGNGRMGRLLLNLMVQQNGYTPIVVKQQDRVAYYQVLRQADAGEYLPITEYMSKLMKESLSLYIKGAKGESIEEDDDIDKEIMLFKKGLGEDKFIAAKNQEEILNAIQYTLIPFLDFFLPKAKQLSTLFLSFEVYASAYSKTSTSFDRLDYKILENNLDFFTTLITQKTSRFLSRSYTNLISPKIDKNLYDINIHFNFICYKKNIEKKDLKLTYSIKFSDNIYYSISQNSSNPFLLKRYGFFPTSEELKELVNEEIRMLLKTIEYLSKNYE